MNEPDPKRWVDAVPRAPLGEILASARQQLPSQEQLTAMADRLGPLLDANGGAAAGVKSASRFVKLGAMTGAASLLLLGGVLLTHGSRVAAPAPTTPRGLSSAPLTPLAPPIAPLPVPAATPVVESPPAPLTIPKKPRAPLPAAATGADSGTTEPALLEQARRILPSSPSAALALTDQHAARFPHGVLTQEREVIAIEALRRLHRTSEADRRAAAFAKAYPGSAHRRMVEEGTAK